MLLAIDVGNTNSVFSVLEGKEIISEWRCSTDGKMTSDQYYIWLQQLFLLQEILPSQIKRVVISSVVPDATFNLKLLAKNYFQSKKPLLTSRHLALVFVDALTVVIRWLPAAMRSIFYL